VFGLTRRFPPSEAHHPLPYRDDLRDRYLAIRNGNRLAAAHGTEVLAQPRKCDIVAFVRLDKPVFASLDETREYEYNVAIVRGKMASWLRTRNTSV
jgi:hypothetical protein